MIDAMEPGARIEQLLHTTIGLDGSTVGTSLIHRAAQRRMRERAVTTLAAYADLLGTDAHELQELVEEVVVSETYFFREREALFALAALVQRRELEPRPDQPLRVLSAPCATGEEPYSIAITLLAAGLPPERLAVDGVDVSHRAVQLARRAQYRRNSFRGHTDQWNHYFDEVADGMAPIARVRGIVRIEEGNVLSPSFRAPHESYDAIFCRNLLIYFDLDAQARLLAVLIRHLAPRGVLFVGAADTFAVRRAGFVALGRDVSFAYRLDEAAGSRARADTILLGFPTGTPERRPSHASRTSATRTSTSRTSASRTPAAPALQPSRSTASPGTASGSGRSSRPRTFGVPPDLNGEPPKETARTAARVSEIAVLANAGRLDDALRLGDDAMAQNERSPHLFALLGTVAAAVGDADSAERHYKRALYLDPDHEESLLHLATLLDSRGDRAGADRLRVRARRSRVTSIADERDR